MRFDKLQILTIAWFGAFLTKAVYFFIAFKSLVNIEYSADFNATNTLLAILGLAIVVFGIILSHKITGKKSVYKSKFLKSLDKGQNPDNSNAQYKNIYFQMKILIIGNMEAAAIFGLVGFLQSYNFYFLIAMMSLSVIGNLLTFPRNKTFRKEILEAEDNY
ncbi:MAG: hypothetical protein JW969_01295 [Spirochaetales bacterium]|nr:hypothetical protein [Spirochaetales bacterium]